MKRASDVAAADAAFIAAAAPAIAAERDRLKALCVELLDTLQRGRHGLLSTMNYTTQVEIRLDVSQDIAEFDAAIAKATESLQ